VDCPVNVGVVVLIKVRDGFDYLPGFLRGCRVVKVDKGIVVYFSFKYRKVFANPVRV